MVMDSAKTSRNGGGYDKLNSWQQGQFSMTFTFLFMNRAATTMREWHQRVCYNPQVFSTEYAQCDADILCFWAWMWAHICGPDGCDGRHVATHESLDQPIPVESSKGNLRVWLHKNWIIWPGIDSGLIIHPFLNIHWFKSLNNGSRIMEKTMGRSKIGQFQK